MNRDDCQFLWPFLFSGLEQVSQILCPPAIFPSGNAATWMINRWALVGNRLCACTLLFILGTCVGACVWVFVCVCLLKSSMISADFNQLALSVTVHREMKPVNCELFKWRKQNRVVATGHCFFFFSLHYCRSHQLWFMWGNLRKNKTMLGESSSLT